ncbi:hypothetical protein [Microbacterium ulmi]|uniref:Uncharacterized protein n=1 Tax=Microbacterium ulmi TaxID=179095 RepID=A0A7Y2Q0A0_9MICO|nr:hypothetical protein [Microbacterium ulmi]NII70255.1 hypothetical protein [Microbacterium ulmi]NNH05336.1 hypothetical protein [Microbacterium ulmi]
MRRTIAATTLVLAALLGLTACTGAPGTASSGHADADGDGGQSVADACQIIQQTIADAADDFQGGATSDPAAIADAMQSAASELQDAASRVTNDEVAALLPSLQDMFGQTAEVMQGLVDGDVSKVGDLAGLGQQFQETTQKFQDLCAG